ncbi:type II toxin-antitoxin system VapC family toxin [Caulobacter sp. BK020]|uniref:type II toxin-antitoxin system VapC family toxin n=1 Tax=Caulobacter sp. BK020 TaxID=2512117 RepID=UPI001042D6B5|nr:type II toxin-antitoxin system VapC family toxin [Caulobacter sp. BK020]TCS16030.1 PIN domain nuclease of toxin-antitoxin system [Caulobacter sp. BK020]
MRLLLDTHALIWFVAGAAALPIAARRAIEDDTNDVFVSAVSAMEVTTKFRLGKLPSAGPLAERFEQAVAERGFLSLPITIGHAERAGAMPIAHKDPFDRLLIAQAFVEDMLLVSNEAAFDGYGVSRLW